MQIYLFSTTYFCKKLFMKIVVVATDEQWKELEQTTAEVEWQRVTGHKNFSEYTDAAAFFYLSEKDALPDMPSPGKPLFINSVTQTLKELHAPSNVFRINGWVGFLQRSTWEIAGEVDETIADIFKVIGKKIIPVPDEPGLIAARIISMIINEAYFATGEEVHLNGHQL
jgi:3-hydroxybutyryl-CoA dehydrogenase